jgi:hypothetical protein
MTRSRTYLTICGTRLLRGDEIMRKIIMGLSPLFLALPSIALAAPPQWQVSETSGEVRLSQNGQSRAAMRGALLASGATITTGAKARAVIVRGEEFVVISPGSQLRVPAADSPNTVMQMIEDFGTAVFKIKKKSTPHFGVQTPYLAAVVKGTTFTVTVGPEGGSVQVTEGAVEVSTLDGGAADLVEPGGIASVGASDLYQLTVDGDASKIIRSENAPSASGVVTSSTALPAQGARAIARDAAPVPTAFTGPATQPMMIGAAIAENPQSLGAVTDGLVEGDVAMELAAVAVHDMRAPDAGLEPKDSNTSGSGSAPAGQIGDTPGRGGGAPGQVGDTSGKSGEAPGQSDDTPGKSGEVPGQIDDTPGRSGEAPGQIDDTPGKSGEAPGQIEDTPGKSGSENSGSGSANSGSGSSGSDSSGDGDDGDSASSADKAAKEAEKAAEMAAEEAAKAAEEAQKAADDAVAEAEKAAEKAAKDAAQAADEAAKDAEKAAKEAAKADDGVCVAGVVCVDIL